MADDTRPVPVPTPVTQPYWDGAKAGELRLQRCEDCAEHIFYPRVGCPFCGSSRLEWTPVSGRARLSSYVIVHVPAPGFAGDAPYVIALVQLDEGPRMMTNLVNVAPDPEALPLDLPLEVVFEPRRDHAIPKFQPVTEASS